MMKALRLSAELTEKSQSSVQRLSASTKRTWRNPKINIERVSVPKADGAKLLIETAYCAINSQDFLFAEASRVGHFNSDQTFQFPVTLGHEVTGIIAEHGSELTIKQRRRLKIGTPVAIERIQWCGSCVKCQAGKNNECENLMELGCSTDGAHSDYLAVDAKFCWNLEILAKKFGLRKALQYGTFLEAYAVTYRALFANQNRASWIPGSHAIVLGSGTIGSAAIDLLRATGISEVIAIDASEESLKLAKRIGATATLSPSDFDLTEKIDTITNNQGAHFIIDTVGDANLTKRILRSSAALGANVILLKQKNSEIVLTPSNIADKNLQIYSSKSHCGTRVFSYLISMMAQGTLHPGILIEDVVNLEEAHKRITSEKQNTGKVLVEYNSIF